MSKIIKLPVKSETVEGFAEEIKEFILTNNGKSVMIAMKCDDGTVLTGYYNCEWAVKLEMLGHVQCDIIDQMILTNLGERY